MQKIVIAVLWLFNSKDIQKKLLKHCSYLLACQSIDSRSSLDLPLPEVDLTEEENEMELLLHNNLQLQNLSLLRRCHFLESG